MARFALWLLTAGGATMVDLVTKNAAHPLVLRHYSHATALDLIPMGLFLLCFAVSGSYLSAFGGGLMFGGLFGNGGELLQHGYATDWILVGPYVTNIADILLVFGLVCINTDLLIRRKRATRRTVASRWLRHVGGGIALATGCVAGLATADLRMGEAVFFLVLIEAFLMERVMSRNRTFA